jgi:methionine-rich copper-binding protein CopC
MAWIYTGTPANDIIYPPTAQVIYYVDGGGGSDTVNTNVPFVNGAFTYSQNPITGVTTLSGASGTGLTMSLHNVKYVGFTNGTWTVPVTTDTTPPSVVSFSPASGAVGVDIASSIALTFSEAIQLGTGNIVLKTAAGATIETFDAATSNRLSISRTSSTAPNYPILTISPTNALANSTQYFVTIAPGTIRDIAGNSYAGTTTYNFTTAAGTGTGSSTWNLFGNGVSNSLDVATAFGNINTINTVWKWVPATSKWAFYAPSMTASSLASYAISKGYDVLTTINSGEGYWVNSNVALTAQLPTGSTLSSSSFADQSNPLINKLPSGWSLISVGDNPTPRSFVNAIATSQPVSPSVAANSLTSLWTWDSKSSSWYFYSPSLDNSGGLASYISTKGYLDFTAKGKTFDPTTGFWVNHP